MAGDEAEHYNTLPFRSGAPGPRDHQHIASGARQSGEKVMGVRPHPAAANDTSPASARAGNPVKPHFAKSFLGRAGISSRARRESDVTPGQSGGSDSDRSAAPDPASFKGTPPTSGAALAR